MRTTLPLAILVALAAVLLNIPPAAAHGAGQAPLDYYARILEEEGDDCGAHGTGNAAGNCRGADDLVAFDLSERDFGAGLELVVRFWFNKGTAFPLTDSVQFKANGFQKTLSIQSKDGQAYASESGFQSVGPVQSRGTDRYSVDAVASFSSLGISAGQSLTDFRVESKSGSNLGDFMPGSCKANFGTDCTIDPETTRDVDYTLRGASYYASLTAPSQTIQVAEGSDSAIVNVEVAGQLASSKQTITVSLQGLDGASGGFHHGAHGDNEPYQSTATVSLTGRQSTNLHLRLHGEQAGTSGTLTLLLTTDLGGRTTAIIPYTVTEPSVQTSSEANHSGHTSSSKGSPAAAAPLVGLALLGLALRRRS